MDACLKWDEELGSGFRGSLLGLVRVDLGPIEILRWCSRGKSSLRIAWWVFWVVSVGRASTRPKMNELVLKDFC